MVDSTSRREIDEETPLITRSPKRSKEPEFPTSQVSLMLLLQLCEPLSSQVIYPFIPQLVSELPVTGGDKNKVGYYAGLIESLFFATEAMTVFHWSRTSDYIGRKPTLLLGLFGLCISMLSFGLSRTFWALVVSRCLCGLLNGNIGVMKTVMGEILTTPDHRARGFAFMPVVWATGATLGPFLGGTLARPHERFPEIFRAKFWTDYPYFLPCAVPAMFTAVVFVVTSLCFKETIRERKYPEFLSCFSRPNRKHVREDSDATLVAEHCKDEPLPIKHVLIPRVIISTSNYGFLCFLDIMLGAIRPLFLAQPIEYGGLGLDPATIGICLGAYGFSCGVFQATCFAKLVRRFGARRLFISSVLASIPVFAIFPLLNTIARAQQGLSPIIWVLLAIQLALCCVVDIAFGCVFLYVTTSAPNRRSLGAVNGLAQTSASISRAVGPSLASSLFSFCVEHNILGGYGAFVFLIGMSCVSARLGSYLPVEMWKNEDEDD